MTRPPVPPVVFSRRAMAVGCLLAAVGAVFFIVGIWSVDDRWAATGAVFAVPGVISLIVGGLMRL